MLRAAHWRASRDGLSQELLDPWTTRRRPAREIVEALIGYVAPALESTGDLDEVRSCFERLVARGSRASRQRAAAERGGLAAVMSDLRARFEASYG